MSIEAEIAQLIEQAEELPIGDYKLAVLNQAIKLAASHNLQELEYEAKMEYADAAIEAGRAEYMLVHFPWIQDYAMAHPTETDIGHVIWLNIWAVFTMIGYPHIEKSLILAAIQDLEGRMQQSQQPTIDILGARLEFQVQLGDVVGAERTYKELDEYILQNESLKPDWEHFMMGFFRERMGNLAEARVLWTPFLYSRTTNRTRLLAKSMMLIPLLLVGELELAKSFYKSCRSKIPNNAEEIACLGDFMVYQSLTGNWQKAVDIFEQSLASVSSKTQGFDLAAYYRGLIHMLKRIPKTIKTLPIRIPSGHPIFREDGLYIISELLAYFSEERSALITALDQRNENTFLAEYHARWDGWADEIQLNS